MKQMEVTVKQIGDAIFYIKPFPAFKSANISGELVKLLTPIVGALVAILTGNKTETGGKDNQETDVESLKANIMDTEIESVMPAVVDAMSTLDGDKIEDMMKKLLVNYKNITVECDATNGAAKLMTYDLANEVFCGELQDMYLLCFEVVKINFGGFFKKLGGPFGNLREIIQKVTPSEASGENST